LCRKKLFISNKKHPQELSTTMQAVLEVVLREVLLQQRSNYYLASLQHIKIKAEITIR